MAPVKVGDYVRVADREATSVDLRNGLFYNYFRNLTGTVERVYEDNTVCIDVDIDSLPEDIRLRHIEIQDTARDKWINGLSQEQRNKLSEQDKQFKMNYKILVTPADVQPEKKGSKPKSQSAQKKADTAVEAAETSGKAKSTASSKPAPSTPKEDEAKRLTENDLSAAEEAFLKSIADKKE